MRRQMVTTMYNNQNNHTFKLSLRCVANRLSAANRLCSEMTVNPLSACIFLDVEALHNFFREHFF